MPAIGLRTLAGDMTFDEVREYLKNPLHQLGMPPEVIELIIKHARTEPSGLEHSPSRILGCHRQAILEETNDYYISLEYEYASLRGTLIHSGIELTGIHTSQVIQEDRVTTMVDTKYGPQPFTAKSDCIVVLSTEHNLRHRETKEPEFVYHARIVDYKTVGEIGHDFTRAQPKHQMQVNCYAYVAVKEAAKLFKASCTVVVDELEIDYFGFTKARRFTSLGPLLTKGHKPRGADVAEELELKPIQMLPLDKVEAFIRRSIERRIEERKSPILPPQLVGEAAKWCPRCPVVGPCRKAG